MKLLILLIGNADKIIRANSLDESDLEIVKLDEKVLSKPGTILRLMKVKKYENVYFGTIELRFQRFQTFMKIYLFLAGIWKGALLDEYGKSNKFSLAKFIFKEIPLFFLEIILSGLLVIIYHQRVYYLRWKYRSN
ncbi:MAG: hypothetical protein A2X64_01225 [Ignavibacteria bacterium GWF2_33_9]|nr:MAG: hypothetical protein A2X64_01225 [Ignavibacteria bacterium GWF2_33_9]